MRRLLVLPICLALAVAGCTQESSDTSVGDPVTTTVVVDTTSSIVVTTTSLAHATTVSVDTAAEAVEAFNASMATVVELSVLLGDEFEALWTGLEEHRTELSEGEAIDACCGARIERINVYDRLMAEEIASLYGQTSNLTPWVEELSDSLVRGGQQGLKQGIGVLDDMRVHLAMLWREVGWGSDTIHIDTALGLLYDCHSVAIMITEYGEWCCLVAHNSSTMEHTIQIDGRLTVDRDDTDPQRSDIIIFSNLFYETVEFTARIVALPTETVEGREDTAAAILACVANRHGGRTVAKLSKEHIVTIKVLNERGESKCSIARTLGVTEGAVRYHLGRQACGAADGRRKTLQLEALGLADAIRAWWEAQQAMLPDDRPPSIESLYAWLQAEHGYPGSYKSVRKFARRYFPPPKRRPFRRIETSPGAQSQTDWAEFRGIDVGDDDGPTTLYAFVMALSHSRRDAVIWSRSMNQLAWHRCHNEAFIRLGGVAAANRIDNLKTGMSRGAGAWGEVNPQYRTYARAMGFHVDACEPRAPEQKGKVERRVGVFKQIDPRRMCFDSMAHLQEWTDAKLDAASHRRICPATGRSVHETWLDERRHLGPLPETMPEKTRRKFAASR